MNLSYLGSVSCIFTSWISLRLTAVSGYRLLSARSQVFFLSSLRVHQFTICDDCDILCLLIRQEIFHFSPCICMDFISEIPSPRPTPHWLLLRFLFWEDGVKSERQKSEVTISFLMGLLLADCIPQLCLQLHNYSQAALTHAFAPWDSMNPTKVATPSSATSDPRVVTY